MINKPIYILSSGRSGSTFITSLFNQIAPDLQIDHQKPGSRIINVISNLPFDSGAILWKLFKLSKRRDRLPFSTADPLLSLALYRFLNSDKINCKVIQLVRNPSDFVNSFMSWKNQSIRKKILHHVVPFWNPIPFFEDSKIDLKYWFNMTKYEKFCWIWKYKNSAFYSLRLNKNIDYFLVRLEDLTSENESIRCKTINEMLEFLELGPKNIIISNISFSKKNESNQNRKFKTSHKSYLKKFISVHCKRLANELGYEINNR
jgi:hypothetical protein